MLPSSYYLSPPSEPHTLYLDLRRHLLWPQWSCDGVLLRMLIWLLKARNNRKHHLVCCSVRNRGVGILSIESLALENSLWLEKVHLRTTVWVWSEVSFEFQPWISLGWFLFSFFSPGCDLSMYKNPLGGLQLHPSQGVEIWTGRNG